MSKASRVFSVIGSCVVELARSRPSTHRGLGRSRGLRRSSELAGSLATCLSSIDATGDEMQTAEQLKHARCLLAPRDLPPRAGNGKAGWNLASRAQSTVTASMAAVLTVAALSFGLGLAAPSAFAQGKPTVPEDVAAAPADAERSASGLAWTVLTEGTGTKRPDKNDRVAVHFTGWTAAGTEFQTSYGQEKPAVFEIQSVFPGWAEAMQLMVEGEKRRFWIPERLGPKNPKSGPTGDVVFDVELIAIQRIANPPESLAKPPEDAERTASGAYSRRLETGWGDEFPGFESAVLLHYTGWTTDGKTFDSTTVRGRPTAFPLGKVMEPFADAVRLMVVGEKRQVWIPGNLAAGNWPGTPEGMLIFELQLVDILPDGAFQSGAIPKDELVKEGNAGS